MKKFLKIIAIPIIIIIPIMFYKDIIAQKLTNNISSLSEVYSENPESNVYLVTDNSISRVIPKTNVYTFKRNFKSNEMIKVYSKIDCNDTDEVAENELVCSGMCVKYELNGKIFKISVLGDLYDDNEKTNLKGDGELDQIELTKIIRNNVKADGCIIEDEIEKLSADITMDGIINNKDIEAIIKYLEIGDILQKNVNAVVKPNIEIVRGNKNEEGKYVNSVKLKIRQNNQRNATLKTIYKIIKITDNSEEKIGEGEINIQKEILLNEQGKYKILAYTYGIEGNKSKESSISLDIIEAERIMTAQIISVPTQYSNLLNKQYEYLEDLIDEIKEKEGNFTIQLLHNVENGSNTINCKNIIIDLNGHEIKNNSRENATIILESGNLTFKDTKDEGKIINEDGFAIQIKNGTLNLGTNDNIIFQKPIIKGYSGSIINEGIVNFYDGIIIGEVNGNSLNVIKKLNIINTNEKPYYTLFDEQSNEDIENITENDKIFYNTIFNNNLNIRAKNVKFINCIFERDVYIEGLNKNGDFISFSNCIFKRNANVNSRFINFMDCKFTGESIANGTDTLLNILSGGEDGVYENISIKNAKGNGLCYHSYGCLFSNIIIENCSENGLKIETGGGSFSDIVVKNNNKNGVIISETSEVNQIQVNNLYAINNGNNNEKDTEEYYGLYAENVKNCYYGVKQCSNNIQLNNCQDISGMIQINKSFNYSDNNQNKNDISVLKYERDEEKEDTIKKIWNDEIINIKSNNSKEMEFENPTTIADDNCYISCYFKNNVAIEEGFSPSFINCKFDENIENRGQSTEFVSCIFENSVQDKGSKTIITGGYFLSNVNNILGGLNVFEGAIEGKYNNIIIRNSYVDGLKYSGSDCSFTNINISSTGKNGLYINNSTGGEFNNIKVFCCNRIYNDSNNTDSAYIEESINESTNYAGVKICNSNNINLYNLNTQQNYGGGMKLENVANCNFIVNTLGNSWHFLKNNQHTQYYGIDIDENSRDNKGILNICASYTNKTYDGGNKASFDGSDKGFIDNGTNNEFSIVMTNYADYNQDKTFAYLWFGKYAPERNIVKYKKINLILNNNTTLDINTGNIKQFSTSNVGDANNKIIVKKEIVQGNKNELEATAELEISGNEITSNKGYFVLDAQHTNLYSFAYIRYKLKNGEIYNDFDAQKRCYTLSKENNRNILYFDIDENIENIESISLEVFVINDNDITIDSNSVKIKAECVFTQ